MKDIIEKNLERKKQLLDNWGEEKLTKVFSELMGIGLNYDCTPEDLLCLLIDEDTKL